MKAIVSAVLAGALLAGVPVVGQDREPSWEGVVEVKSKKLERVYLRPQADFRAYTKVMIDPTQVAFRKNWQRDQNSDRMTLDTRISDTDARKILDEAQKGFQDLFAKAYEKAGYQVVTQAGPDVLRLSTAVINLDVTAPDIMTAGITRTYSSSAGEATLVLEARDSLTGELLGRAADRRESSDMGPYLRNRGTNAVEFERIFSDWAKASADGLSELKGLSPIDSAALAKKR